jgi:hypothetical protein
MTIILGSLANTRERTEERREETATDAIGSGLCVKESEAALSYSEHESWRSGREDNGAMQGGGGEALLRRGGGSQTME